MLSKRSTGFGYGSRSDFTKTYSSSPGATRYNPETTLFSTRGKEKGKTFGISRDVRNKLIQLSPEGGVVMKGVLKNPGVGSYNFK